ncbi:DUF2783 domain-containing protein [Acidovorax sp.]|uniref:DUF2783 domain-containing protein n=1 Tax=Acidovorax sp. TaxID=1872122 RepID=UPI002ACD3CBF|nr:DUF2783 domain-containing protein [Acidovorax sp.]MDZ7861772.1 DUF2783 domain-containing protein [Acidovorax sp.]
MLDTQPHLQACDDFYEALIASHNGLTPPESHAMNARLILLLANHIGDQATLLHALQLARGSTVPAGNADIAPMTPVPPIHAAA